MAFKDFTDGEVLYSADLNGNFETSIYNSAYALTAHVDNIILYNDASLTYLENDGFIVEAFIDSTGYFNYVSTGDTDALFSSTNLTYALCCYDNYNSSIDAGLWSETAVGTGTVASENDDYIGVGSNNQSGGNNYSTLVSDVIPADITEIEFYGSVKASTVETGNNTTQTLKFGDYTIINKTQTGTGTDDWGTHLVKFVKTASTWEYFKDGVSQASGLTITGTQLSLYGRRYCPTPNSSYWGNYTRAYLIRYNSAGTPNGVFQSTNITLQSEPDTIIVGLRNIKRTYSPTITKGTVDVSLDGGSNWVTAQDIFNPIDVSSLTGTTLVIKIDNTDGEYAEFSGFTVYYK